MVVVRKIAFDFAFQLNNQKQKQNNYRFKWNPFYVI